MNQSWIWILRYSFANKIIKKYFINPHFPYPSYGLNPAIPNFIGQLISKKKVVNHSKFFFFLFNERNMNVRCLHVFTSMENKSLKTRYYGCLAALFMTFSFKKGQSLVLSCNDWYFWNATTTFPTYLHLLWDFFIFFYLLLLFYFFFFCSVCYDDFFF